MLISFCTEDGAVAELQEMISSLVTVSFTGDPTVYVAAPWTLLRALDTNMLDIRTSGWTMRITKTLFAPVM